MNLVTLTNLLWIAEKTIEKYQDKLDAFTAKYVSGPVAGYIVFGILLFLSIIFIRRFAGK